MVNHGRSGDKDSDDNYDNNDNCKWRARCPWRWQGYDNAGNKVGEVPGYWHDVRREIVRNYYDYKATLFRGVIETAPVTP